MLIALSGRLVKSVAGSSSGRSHGGRGNQQGGRSSSRTRSRSASNAISSHTAKTSSVATTTTTTITLTTSSTAVSESVPLEEPKVADCNSSFESSMQKDAFERTTIDDRNNSNNQRDFNKEYVPNNKDCDNTNTSPEKHITEVAILSTTNGTAIAATASFGDLENPKDCALCTGSSGIPGPCSLSPTKQSIATSDNPPVSARNNNFESSEPSRWTWSGFWSFGPDVILNDVNLRYPFSYSTRTSTAAASPPRPVLSQTKDVVNGTNDSQSTTSLQVAHPESVVGHASVAEQLPSTSQNTTSFDQDSNIQQSANEALAQPSKTLDTVQKGKLPSRQTNNNISHATAMPLPSPAILGADSLIVVNGIEGIWEGYFETLSGRTKGPRLMKVYENFTIQIAQKPDSFAAVGSDCLSTREGPTTGSSTIPIPSNATSVDSSCTARATNVASTSMLEGTGGDNSNKSEVSHSKPYIAKTITITAPDSTQIVHLTGHGQNQYGIFELTGTYDATTEVLAFHRRYTKMYEITPSSTAANAMVSSSSATTTTLAQVDSSTTAAVTLTNASNGGQRGRQRRRRVSYSGVTSTMPTSLLPSIVTTTEAATTTTTTATTTSTKSTTGVTSLDGSDNNLTRPHNTRKRQLSWKRLDSFVVGSSGAYYHSVGFNDIDAIPNKDHDTNFTPTPSPPPLYGTGSGGRMQVRTDHTPSSSLVAHRRGSTGGIMTGSNPSSLQQSVSTKTGGGTGTKKQRNVKLESNAVGTNQNSILTTNNVYDCNSTDISYDTTHHVMTEKLKRTKMEDEMALCMMDVSTNSTRSNCSGGSQQKHRQRQRLSIKNPTSTMIISTTPLCSPTLSDTNNSSAAFAKTLDEKAAQTCAIVGDSFDGTFQTPLGSSSFSKQIVTSTPLDGTLSTTAAKVDANVCGSGLNSNLKGMMTTAPVLTSSSNSVQPQFITLPSEGLAEMSRWRSAHFLYYQKASNENSGSNDADGDGDNYLTTNTSTRTTNSAASLNNLSIVNTNNSYNNKTATASTINSAAMHADSGTIQTIDTATNTTTSTITKAAKFVVYEGEMYNSQRFGRGACVYFAGTSSNTNTNNGNDGQQQQLLLYEGEWRFDKEHGQGILMTSNRKRIIYQGEWERGKFHGKGIYYYNHPDLEEVPCDTSTSTSTTAKENNPSSLIDSPPNSQGLSVIKSTASSIVTTTIDKKENEKLTKKKFIQSYYEGEFRENVRQGIGTYVLPDGSIYSGMWQNGLMNGRGTFTWADGSVYDGEWKDGKRHGNGLLKASDGFVYDGSWVHSTMEGRGCAIYPNGQQYNGSFHNGCRDGRGTLIFTNGAIYEGRFRDDAIDGQGTLKISNAILVPSSSMDTDSDNDNDNDIENVTIHNDNNGNDLPPSNSLNVGEKQTDKKHDIMIPISFHSDIGYIHRKAGFSVGGE